MKYCEKCCSICVNDDACTSSNNKLLDLNPDSAVKVATVKGNLKAIVEVLKKHPQIIVLADEIYQHILYTGKHETLAQFPELEDRLIIINGVSKAYAMTGYRIGWLACHDKDFITAVEYLNGQLS